MTPVNIAIDLETLGTSPDAVILSVGLVAFTISGGIVGTYYVELDQDEQIDQGRSVDPRTMEWWRNQSDEAQMVLRGGRGPTRDALAAIATFFNRFDTSVYCIEGVWGYGSDFDNVMLRSLYDSFDCKWVPWSYKLNRCGRTLVAEHGRRAPDNGVKHNALDDATWLANTVRRCLAPQLF